MSNRKGTRLEHRTRVWDKEAGFTVFRVAGSFGPVDLVALHPYKLELAQVKANRWCGRDEQRTLEALERAVPRCRRCGDKLGEVVQVRWNDYAREPKQQAFRADRWVRLDV
jgi:hypothetical protein